MSPDGNIIELDPIEIAGDNIPESSETFDIDPQHADTLQSHIQTVSGGRAVNICL
jgi:hypothetical protein